MSIIIKCQKTDNFVYGLSIDVSTFKTKNIVWEKSQGFFKERKINDNPFIFVEYPDFIDIKVSEERLNQIISKLKEFSYRDLSFEKNKLRTPTCVIKGMFKSSLFIQCLGKTREHETFKQWSYFTDNVKIGDFHMEGYVVNNVEKMMSYFSGKRLIVTKKHIPSISKESLKFFIAQLLAVDVNDKIEITSGDKSLII